MQALYRNHMGNDLEVVRDARISFAASSEARRWESLEIPNVCDSVPDHQRRTHIPTLSESDQNLIGFLARGCRSGEWANVLNDLTESNLPEVEVERLAKWIKRLPPHWTPFGQQVIKLRMKAPIPVRTQAFKHKIGMVENEESRRYIKTTPELFVPEFRSAPEDDIKQGSGGPHINGAHWQNHYTYHCRAAISLYEQMIEDGVAPEQARFVLPQGVYVNWVWTGSLFAYAEFFNKRSDPHAQQEIRDLAQAVSEIVEPLFPVSWQALTS